MVLFTPPGSEERMGSFSEISLTADDIETTYQEVVEAGCPFEPLKVVDWGGRQAIFQDLE